MQDELRTLTGCFLVPSCMKNRFKGQTEIAQDELERNKQIKPKLTKFVTDLQKERAEAASKGQKEEATLLLSRSDVIDRAGKLSCVAFFEQRVWVKVPPYFEMSWLTKPATTQHEIEEMNGDVAGFATYLAREYNNYLKFKTLKRGYPNPMQEENLGFFWEKFNADLALLMAGEKLRVAKGNNSILFDDVMSSNSSPLSNLILPNTSKQAES